MPLRPDQVDRARPRPSPSTAWLAFTIAVGLLTSIQPALAAERSQPTTTSYATPPSPAPMSCASGDVGHQLFFAADDGIHGTELWATDGTSEGTRMVRDIDPDGPSDPQPIGVMDGIAYFFADDGVHGPEPWRSDGTEAGTWLLADLRPSRQGSAPWRPRPATRIGDHLIFVAVSRGGAPAVWSTDGTTEGTRPLEGFPSAGPLARADDLLYRRAIDEAGDVVVWRADGTAQGTWPLTDTGPLLVYADPVAARDQVVSARDYGVERDETTGWKVWSGEGLPDVGPVFMYDDLFEGPGLMPVTILGDRLLFYADAGDGFSLWASDGTAVGTGEIGPIGPRGRHGQHDLPEPLAILDDRAILLAQDDRGEALWVTDGTAVGTHRLASLWWADREHMSWVAPVVAGGRVYFEAHSADRGRQVWVTDGTEEGMRRLTSLPRGVRPVDLTVVGERLLIGVSTSDRRPQLWASDGTRRGTRLMEELPANPSFWTTPVFLDGAEKGALIIHPLRSRSTGQAGELEVDVFGLSASDGTKRGTRPITGVSVQIPKGMGPEEQAWQIGALAGLFEPVTVDGRIYFRNADPVEPERYAGLWRSDGSADGTERVSPVVPSTFLGAIAAGQACVPDT